MDGDTTPKTVKATPVKATGAGSKTEMMQIADTPAFLEMSGDISMSTISVSNFLSTFKKGIVV